MSDQLDGQEPNLHELLANERRRLVVWALAAVGSPQDLETLAQFVLAMSRMDTHAARQRKPVRELRNSLRNRHLLQLEEAGVINQTTVGIEAGPQFDVAIQLLAISQVAD